MTDLYGRFLSVKKEYDERVESIRGRLATSEEIQWHLEKVQTMHSLSMASSHLSMLYLCEDKIGDLWKKAN